MRLQLHSQILLGLHAIHTSMVYPAVVTLFAGMIIATLRSGSPVMSASEGEFA